MINSNDHRVETINFKSYCIFKNKIIKRKKEKKKKKKKYTPYVPLSLSLYHGA